MDFFINDANLKLLAIFDVIIVYLFCCLQMSYNILTAKYITKSRAKVNALELWRAFLFSLAPIVYSLLPILLVLYYYVPNDVSHIQTMPGKDFALILVWIHLPPIILVYICIISWIIILIIHNKKIDSFKLLRNETNLINQDEQIKIWDTKTKIIFRKVIYKWYLKMINSFKKASDNRDKKYLLKLITKLEGWYVAKQRFQFFWCTKKAYHWIKKYYETHYLGLRYYAQKSLKIIENN